MVMVNSQNLEQLPRSSYLGFVCSKRQYKERSERGISVIIRRHIIIASTCFAVAFSIIAPMIWLSQPPVSQVSNIVVNKNIKSGENLIVESSVFRSKLCATKIERTIFDGSGMRWVMTDLDFASAPGPLGNQTYRQAIPLPKEAYAGHSSLYIGLVWSCPFSLFQSKNVIGPLNFTIEP